MKLGATLETSLGTVSGRRSTFGACRITFPGLVPISLRRGIVIADPRPGFSAPGLTFSGLRATVTAPQTTLRRRRVTRAEPRVTLSGSRAGVTGRRIVVSGTPGTIMETGITTTAWRNPFTESRFTISMRAFMFGSPDFIITGLRCAFTGSAIPASRPGTTSIPARRPRMLVDPGVSALTLIVATPLAGVILTRVGFGSRHTGVTQDDAPFVARSTTVTLPNLTCDTFVTECVQIFV